MEEKEYYRTEYMCYGLGDVHNITARPIDPLKSWNEYAITDHLGNVRSVVDEGNNVVGQYDYKPFGEVLWQSAPVPRLSFIDKEKDAENGLGDFGVRKYDDGIGRFTSIDPDWEEYREWSPYNYAENNPMRLVDPSGYGPWDKLAKNIAKSPIMRKIAPNLSRNLDKAEKQAERWANKTFDKAVRWTKEAYKNTKEFVQGSLKDGKSNASQEVPKLRQAYMNEVSTLKKAASEMRGSGASSEAIARTLHAQRRAIGVKYKDLVGFPKNGTKGK